LSDQTDGGGGDSTAALDELANASAVRRTNAKRAKAVAFRPCDRIQPTVCVAAIKVKLLSPFKVSSGGRRPGGALKPKLER
jgi:hypothetical protein